MAEQSYSCRRCGRSYRKRRSLTNRGYCPDCGMAAWADSVHQITNRKGEVWERYRQRRIEGVLREAGEGLVPGDTSAAADSTS